MGVSLNWEPPKVQDPQTIDSLKDTTLYNPAGFGGSLFLEALILKSVVGNLLRPRKTLREAHIYATYVYIYIYIYEFMRNFRLSGS